MLLQCLAMPEGVDVAALAGDGPDFVHRVVEAMKPALAARDRFLGDPDHVAVPPARLPARLLARLLSQDDAARRRGMIGEGASRDRHAALLAQTGRKVGQEAPGSGLGPGEPTFADLPEIEGDTVPLSVIDRWGNRRVPSSRFGAPRPWMQGDRSMASWLTRIVSSFGNRARAGRPRGQFLCRR